MATTYEDILNLFREVVLVQRKSEFCPVGVRESSITNEQSRRPR